MRIFLGDSAFYSVCGEQVKREPSEEIDLLDTMFSSLVELLEEKGILTQAEYEKRIMEKVKIK